MNDIRNGNPRRCPECGSRIPGTGDTCPVCGVSMAGRRVPVGTSGGNSATGIAGGPIADPLTVQRTGLASSPPATTGSRSPVRRGGGVIQGTSAPPQAAISILSTETATQGADVTGRVIAVEHSHTEPRGFDICRVLTKTLWFLALLPVIVVVGGVLLALRCFSGTDLLWMGYFFRGNGRAAEQIPVWYARVRREDDGAEVMVRIKGAYATGNVGADDIVSFWGTWQDGVLIAKRGLNHRTRSKITFHRSIWPVLLLLTLAMIVGLAICLKIVASHPANLIHR